MEENLEHSDWLKGIKETGFTTPSNYFDGLNESIQAKLALENLRESVGETGLSVPDGYFEQLQTRILAQTTGISLRKPEPALLRLWHSKMLKYASAACFVIVASIGTLYYNQQPEQKPAVLTEEMATEQMLYDIDEELIIEHIENNSASLPKVSASEVAMESYILNNYSQNELVTDF